MSFINDWYTKRYTSSFENRDQAKGAFQVYKSQDDFWAGWASTALILALLFLAVAFLTGALFQMSFPRVSIAVLFSVSLPIVRLAYVEKVRNVCGEWLDEHPADDEALTLPARTN